MSTSHRFLIAAAATAFAAAAGATVLYVEDLGGSAIVGVAAIELQPPPVGLLGDPEFPGPCQWDCGNSDGDVGIVDLLALLAQWGSAGSCDFDGGGVGITDFLALLGNWGPCP